MSAAGDRFDIVSLFPEERYVLPDGAARNAQVAADLRAREVGIGFLQQLQNRVSGGIHGREY